jgi:hypothetical protein
MLVVAAGILTLSRDRGLAIGMAAIIAIGAVFAGLAWAPAFRRPSSRPAPTATRSGPSAQPLDWHGEPSLRTWPNEQTSAAQISITRT